MTDRHDNEAPDGGTPAEPPERAAGDRGITPVARTNSNQRLAMVFFGLAIAGVIAWINWPTDSADVKLTDPQEEFSPASPPPTLAQPPQTVVLRPVQPAPEPAPPPRAEIDPYERQQQLRLQEIAMRRAEEAERRRLERLRSEILIVDRGGSGPQAEPRVAAADSGQEPASFFGQAGDEDLSREETFARRADNNSVATVDATRLRNLDKIIPQGTMIRGTLETAIQSDLPGMVRAVVSQDVYSFDGRRLLIPGGARLIGRYQSGLVRGQTRVFVIWTRAILPDGVSVLVGSPGTDELGRAGLEGFLDTHFWRRFGNSILLSLIDGAIQAGVEAIGDDSANVAISGGRDFSRSAEIALENSINIPPTIHIDQGTRINVFVAKDLDFTNVIARQLQ